MYELIITEKPKTAARIAEALADDKPIKKLNKKIPYYQLKHKGREIVVACAVGHVYSLDEKKKKGYSYPVFEIIWKPAYLVSKDSKHTKPYIDTIKLLSKGAETVTIATDYDIEGEVIGLNCVRYACERGDAHRMKFSTLTAPDLVEAFDNASDHLDWGQAKAGDTRHRLDWFYGINLSRALMQSYKSRGGFKVLSSGRVQGPALRILVEREREIMAFKPVPYWVVRLAGLLKGSELEATHEEGDIFDKSRAEEIKTKVEGNNGSISSIKATQSNKSPPFPFDLTTLQVEAHKVFGISPKDALSTAQSLYTEGLISYPRTSSQQLPEKLGYRKLIEALKSQETYREHAGKLLTSAELKPNNGKKTDPAHPAIYPTGLVPKHLNPYEHKIYDLIVRRFLSTFGTPAVRETVQLLIGVNGENFIAKGTRTIEEGWFEYYKPYVKLEEVELPSAAEGDPYDVKDVQVIDKETQPPKRFTEASLIRELEKRNLGTKATRAAIIEALYQRGYVSGSSIQVNQFGLKIFDTLQQFSPEIVDEELTQHFEDQMAAIEQSKATPEEILTEATETLNKILKKFKEQEKQIGERLKEADQAAREEASRIGPCPVCKQGTLRVKSSRKVKSRFVACDRYPDCKAIYNVPNTGTLKASKKECKHCGFPTVLISRGRRTQEVCINPDCPGKGVKDEEVKKEVDEVKNGVVEKECPKCKSKLVIRTSVYGQFYGCSNFPKCRYTEKLNDGPLKEDFSSSQKG